MDKTDCPRFPGNLRKMWTGGEVQSWLDANIQPLLDSQSAAHPSTQAAKDVLAERLRQIHTEGWTHAHDDGHNQGEIAHAAGCYVLFAKLYPHPGESPGIWPWDARSWKPTTYRAALVKAGALILAELERIDRAAGPR